MRILPFLLVASFCFTLSCTTGPATNKTAPLRLRVLSYNIHHAEGTDGRLDLARIASIIRATEPDLVALQEVDDRTTRSKGVNQAAELGKLTGMIANFGQAMPYQGGGYGQAILSKWPVQVRMVHTLPQRVGREPRICVVARMSAGEKGPEFLFATTHLDHEIEEIRVQQAEKLNAILSTNSLPTILAGDFNAVPDSRTMNVLLPQWIDAATTNAQPTIPAENPRRRIDYILLDAKTDWRVIETRVIEEPVASDHRPVLAIVELAPR